MVLYRLLADLVVMVHAAYVAFVVLGLLVIRVGIGLRWNWVRNFWFRMAHLAAILIVCLEASIGIVCPLTTLENYLRARGGQGDYAGDFIGYWVHELIFVEAPPWVFTFCYILFGYAVLSVFVFAPPHLPFRNPMRRESGQG